MVAVSGEDLEDIARDRNKCTPELKYFFLYRMIFLTATIPPSLPGKWKSLPSNSRKSYPTF